ncbi:MAG: hypothetical protein H6618_03530 [Deltaproteobacteria bacterium]|nr:hypothetical protein [Deltaproteobacteria bacterium]
MKTSTGSVRRHIRVRRCGQEPPSISRQYRIRAFWGLRASAKSGQLVAAFCAHKQVWPWRSYPWSHKRRLTQSLCSDNSV